jgi:hypothetical protein
MDVAFVRHDRTGEVADEAIDQAMEIDLAQALGDVSRILHVDEQKDALLDAWPKVTARNETQQDVLAEQAVQIEEEVDHEADRDKRQKVARPNVQAGERRDGRELLGRRDGEQEDDEVE